MRIVAALTELHSIRRYLSGIGLPPEPPEAAVFTIRQPAKPFEAGIGVTFVRRSGVISPDKWSTKLLWARVGGREYGERPTAITGAGWGRLKSNLLWPN